MDEADDYVERGPPSWWLRVLEPTDRQVLTVLLMLGIAPVAVWRTWLAFG